MGIYQQTLNGVNGCDSILNITIVELPLNSASLDLEICQGSSIDVNGEIYDAMGIYQQTLIGADGCDSILTITIEALLSSVSNLDLEVCQGESVDVNGELYDQMGSYQQTLMGTNGCDSLLMIEITELVNTSETIEAKICEDATIQINDEVYNATGTYEQVLINSSGCDSILTIEIEAFPIAAETVQGEFCQGDSFEINNEQFDAPGVYEQVLISAEGCDSILTIELEALPLNLDSLNAQICNDESITVNGETYDVPGSYTQIRSAQMGCDTLLTIDVEILPDSEEIIFEDLCEGEEVEYNGQTYAMAGSYEQELIASNGCDSTLTIEIRILPNYEVCDTITLYEGEEVVVNGEVYNQPGTYQQLLQTVDGCDSLINIKIGIIILSEALVYYSLNDCKAGGASFEEFIPEYTSDYECSIIDASLLYRPSGFLHSCTPGMDESSGMCISSLESCEFDQESEYKLVFEVDITPIDSATIISGISFFEKAPFMFEYEIGTTGLNNYPTLYSIRILRLE